MARFLMALWPFAGHVHPNLAVAREMLGRGHEVAMFTGEQARSSVEAAGLRFFPFQNLDGEAVEQLVRTVDRMSLSRGNPRRLKQLMGQWLLGTIDDQIADLEPLLEAWQPDVIVNDLAMWGPILVLHEKHRIPVAMFSYVAHCMLPGPQGPVVGFPMPRPERWYQKLGHRALRAAMKLGTRDVRKAANEIRARHGLPPIRVPVNEYAGRMPLYLVAGTREFDRNRIDLPPSVRYVGPCLWNGASSGEPPAWLERLDRSRPVVYVTEGTMHEKASLLLPAALEGLAGKPYQVVMSTGRHRTLDDLTSRPLPENIRVEQWVDHSQLYPRLDVLVTTGGTGTLLGALEQGIPAVVVPTAWDQPENAWRVHEHGVGIRIPPGQCTPKRLAEEVDRVLTESSYRRNAQRLAETFGQYGGPSQAADLLEQLAGKPARSSSSEATAVSSLQP